MKRCTRCGELKPLSKFGKHSIGKNGLSCWCKKCNNERTKAFSKTASGIYTGIKSRSKYFKAKESPIYKPVEISREDFVEWYDSQQKTCGYCGIPEKKSSVFLNKYGGRTRRLTIDCKDNDLGYVVGNLILACDKCNMTKNNILTYDEMLYVGRNFIRPKWEALMSLSPSANPYTFYLSATNS